ncbi:hypothetical protein LHJ74_11130 [Streptomyces sp. N2-109]|uniref:Uncharacterized protein n=1 Tax=Streptomyces gossypii TaxID=2883101 RepID=A0ABT2JRS7_9ACTN|nr:hypothetical protein [Streptomyces gossypii]MCT2590456.1 hypothetical protein [Streptomyces gossypii]
MSDAFQAEWDALVSQARAGQQTRMQLNSPAPVGGAGGSGKLSTDEAAKTGAASYVEETLLPDIRSAHGLVGGASAARPSGLLGAERPVSDSTLLNWQTSSGLDDVLRKWGKQVRNLEQRMRGERDALRGAKVLYQTQDARVHEDFASGLGRYGTDANSLGTTNPGDQLTGLRPAG